MLFALNESLDSIKAESELKGRFYCPACGDEVVIDEFKKDQLKEGKILQKTYPYFKHLNRNLNSPCQFQEETIEKIELQYEIGKHLLGMEIDKPVGSIIADLLSYTWNAVITCQLLPVTLLEFQERIRIINANHLSAIWIWSRPHYSNIKKSKKGDFFRLTAGLLERTMLALFLSKEFTESKVLTSAELKHFTPYLSYTDKQLMAFIPKYQKNKRTFVGDLVPIKFDKMGMRTAQTKLGRISGFIIRS